MADFLKVLESEKIVGSGLEVMCGKESVGKEITFSTRDRTDYSLSFSLYSEDPAGFWLTLNSYDGNLHKAEAMLNGVLEYLGVDLRATATEDKLKMAGTGNEVTQLDNAMKLLNYGLTCLISDYKSATFRVTKGHNCRSERNSPTSE